MTQQATKSILLGLALFLVPGCTSLRHQAAPPPRDRAQAEHFNQRGLELAQAGRLADAEQSFRKALDADPYLGPAHSNLGVALLQMGKLFDAGWELRQACQLMPSAAPPRTNLGILYQTVGRQGLAEDNFRAALLLAPEDLQIIGQLALLKVRQNQADGETVAWLQQLTEQDNDPAWRSWAGEKLALLKNAPH